VTAAAPADPATWLLAQVTEQELQAFVRRTARLLGWRVHHEKYSIGSDSGYPDLTLLHPGQGRTVWMELKREGKWPTRRRKVNGRWRDGQDGWLLDLLEAGNETYLVWPCDRQDVAELLQFGPREDMPCLGRLRTFLREGLVGDA
jgi:hypothetical protein